MNTAWFSIKRRLLMLLLGGVAAAWLGTFVFSYFDAHHEVDELFDAQMAQAAQTLLALANHDKVSPIENLGEAAHKYQRRLRCQLWNAEGRLLMRSQSAPETPLTAVDGFSETDDATAGHWRHYSQWNAERTVQVQVSEDHRVRDELIGQIAWRLILPALPGLPLIGLWVWLATRRGLSSLDETANDIARRDPHQLQPLNPATAPSEIRPLLEALNGLLHRVDQTLENERRFTADAAHELRTPLAALQAQLQVALRARDDAERNQSLNNLQQGLHRAARLVDQMLLLARLDPESGLPDAQAVSLAPLAEEVCATLGSDILARNIDFDLQSAPGCVITGRADWLQILIRNLLDNALRYTPPGGRISLVVESVGQHIRLSINDNGPGIPAEERANALRRFHRLEGTAQPGSGLGLAIAGRIAELHGATLSLNDSPFDQGLSVVVDFAARPASRPTSAPATARSAGPALR